MKIIYLHQYFKFPSEEGGTRSYDLANCFLKNNIEVEIVTSTNDNKYKNNKRWAKLEHNGLTINIMYLPYDNKLSNFKRIIVFFKFVWFSTFKLLSIKSDLVLATSTPLTIGIPAIIKKKIHKTPFIFEVRDVWPEAVIAIGAFKNIYIQKLLYTLEKKIYTNATSIIPLSVDMQKSINSRYPELINKTQVVIENIAEIYRFHTNNSNPFNLKDFIGFQPRFSVLYAGTFGKVNGIHKLIELAEKTIAIDSKLVYILIGSGSEKEIIRQNALAKKILNKNLFIFNPIPKKELPNWYNSVSMGSSFVINIPSLWANSANKFFDTLASSKPILINHEGWQADLIRTHNIGYVLPLDISQEVAIDFVKYTHNELLLNIQQKNALTVAEQKYSLQIATNKYLNIFNSIISDV